MERAEISQYLHHLSGLELAGLIGVFAVWIFLPTLIAGFRRHRAFRMIALINIVLFWEFWVWVPLMVWACTDRENAAVAEKFRAVTSHLTALFKRRAG